MDQSAAPYERDGVLIIPLSGQFDVGNVGDLERHLSEVSTGRTVLDFGDTGYIDSSILAVLIRRKKAMGASVGFAVPKSSNVRLIFEIAGLLDVLGVDDSLDQAVKRMAEVRLEAG